MARLKPKEIRFTQDSVASRFRDGMYLSDTFEQILYRRITPDDIEAIQVVEENGVWLALTGNRRLYIYRKLENLGIISTVPVVIRDISDWYVCSKLSEMRTTTCAGVSAHCRQPEADRKMNQTVAEWRRQLNRQQTSWQTPRTVPRTQQNYNTPILTNRVPSYPQPPSDIYNSNIPRYYGSNQRRDPEETCPWCIILWNWYLRVYYSPVIDEDKLNKRNNIDTLFTFFMLTGNSQENKI